MRYSNPFEVTGTFKQLTEHKSAKGNAYGKFLLDDSQGATFDFVVFGDAFAMAKQLKPGKTIVVKGSLGSEPYQDKTGATRYGTRLNVKDIDEPKATGMAKGTEMPKGEFDEIPF